MIIKSDTSRTSSSRRDIRGCENVEPAHHPFTAMVSVFVFKMLNYALMLFLEYSTAIFDAFSLV